MPARSLNATTARHSDATPGPARTFDGPRSHRGVECEGALGPAASRDATRAAKVLAWQSEPDPADFVDAPTTREIVDNSPAEFVDAMGVDFKNLARGASQQFSASEPGPGIAC